VIDDEELLDGDDEELLDVARAVSERSATTTRSAG
jgi:hypothetical protein